MDLTITRPRRYPPPIGARTAGEVVRDVPEDLAAQLISQDLAELLVAPREVEDIEAARDLTEEDDG